MPISAAVSQKASQLPSKSGRPRPTVLLTIAPR